MKKLLFTIILILVFSTVFVSCKKDKDPEPLKIGLVTGLGTLTDRGFNQMAYEGLLLAAEEEAFVWEIKESNSVAEIVDNINYFTGNKFDVIITMTYDASQPALDAANLYPGIKFVLLDFSFDNLPANMSCITYKVDQVSFPCGFLAASWAHQQNPTSVNVGYVAGPDIPNIQQFTQSFVAGVEYFNDYYGLNAAVAGANATSFNDTLQGAQLADSLILLGAEVIFACAGKTGNGALYQVKKAGKVALGVDTDQFLTIPEVGDILLTSCMKRLNVSVHQEILSIINGEFQGGQTINFSLENSGVDLAPYHNFETLIPDSIKSAIMEIKQGIMDGTIATGW